MSEYNNILNHTDCLSQEQLQAYLDNNLDKLSQHAVENHLTDCMFCSDALEGLQILSPQESKQQLAEIKNNIEQLLFDTETISEENEITEEKEKVAPQLTVKKGGKSISFVAAAALFFLIFAGGLVVFSYINNNTNWLGNEQPQLAKGDDSKNEISLQEDRTTNGEVEIYSLDPNDLQDNKPQTVAKESEKALVPPLKENINKPNTKTREDALVGNTRNIPVAAPPLPSVASTPPKAATETRAEKEVVAKRLLADDEVIERSSSAGSRNTYSQPLYDGKMKDLNKEPSLTKTSRDKKTKSAVITAEEELQNAERNASSDQSSQNNQYNQQKKKAEADNYELGIAAFNQGNYRESIKFLKRALRRKDFNNPEEANYYLALAYEQTNELAKARKIYEELENSEAYKKRAQSRLREMPVK